MDSSERVDRLDYFVKPNEPLWLGKFVGSLHLVTDPCIDPCGSLTCPGTKGRWRCGRMPGWYNEARWYSSFIKPHPLNDHLVVWYLSLPVVCTVCHVSKS